MVCPAKFEEGFGLVHNKVLVKPGPFEPLDPYEPVAPVRPVAPVYPYDP